MRDHADAIGLQASEQIDPKAGTQVGGSELCLSDADGDTVDRLYAECTAHGVPIALEPTKLAFGYTFVANDPDGHRLRVCATDIEESRQPEGGIDRPLWCGPWGGSASPGTAVIHRG